MKAIELKATLQGGTSIAVMALDKPIITLHKPSGDQREGDYNIRFSMLEWEQVLEAVRELMLMVEGRDKPTIGSAR